VEDFDDYEDFARTEKGPPPQENEPDICLNENDIEDLTTDNEANCKYKGAEDEPNNLCDDGVEDLNVGNE
ncbi:hypothetical protein FRX31_015440, partial [Thalictrum thalictroides]